MVLGPRLPGEPEPKHLKFEHMLKAGEEREDKEVKILKQIWEGSGFQKVFNVSDISKVAAFRSRTKMEENFGN